MTDERSHVGAQRHVIEGLDILARRSPRSRGFQCAQYMVAGQRLDSTEQIRPVERVDVDGRQRAVAHEHGGDPVSHGLRQSRPHKHFRVVVRVGVDEPRHQPLAVRVDDVGVGADGQLVGSCNCDDTVADSEISHDAGSARSVEPESAAHDDVVYIYVVYILVAFMSVIHTTSHAESVDPDRG